MEWSLDCKVYVGNLGSGAAKHEIEAAFTKFGPLRNVWVARNPPGFAFVEFEDSRDAEDACRALDGSRLCGTRVRVEMSHGRSRRGGASRRPPAPPPRYGGYGARRSRACDITSNSAPRGTKVTQPTTTTTFLLRQQQQPPPHFYLAAREGFAADAAG
ncbi:RNA-binding protein 1 isoform X1 [Rhipicephalus sanguineus]|uniref:RNA-binding protein 1 isoform X1 n=1 Tax=Rhipicephalus sanguineus TaxID=34632 RepID=UPI001894D977|nr:RNA-binding protein 1 isoform X1 [Rhipicephalus sanguineus]